MNPETLLGLISRYGTSADLPTIPEMAHSYIDQIKETYDQQQQRDMQIQGQGIGLLDMVTGPAKAASLISVGTPKFMKIMKDLKLDVIMSPRMREFGLKNLKRRRDLKFGKLSPEDAIKQAELESKTAEFLTSAGYTPKYKDAPYRAMSDLEDLVVKIDALSKPTAKSKMAAEYRHEIDKHLLSAMEDIEKAGGVNIGTEANIKNIFKSLMDLINK
jgi:hypothetical protein